MDCFCQVDVSSLDARLIYTDMTQQQTLTGSYMMAFILVDGDVDVASINGINLQDLNSAVVKTTGDFTLQGWCLHNYLDHMVYSAVMGLIT